LQTFILYIEIVLVSEHKAVGSTIFVQQNSITVIYLLYHLHFK